MKHDNLLAPMAISNGYLTSGTKELLWGCRLKKDDYCDDTPDNGDEDGGISHGAVFWEMIMCADLEEKEESTQVETGEARASGPNLHEPNIDPRVLRSSHVFISGLISRTASRTIHPSP